MLHPMALISSCITKLKEQLEEVTKRKSRKRKRIQQGGIIEYGEGAAQVAAEASMALQLLKKACSSNSYKRAQLGIQRYRNYRGTKYNAQTYKKDIEESSKSKISIIYIGSLFNSNKNLC